MVHAGRDLAEYTGARTVEAMSYFLREQADEAGARASGLSSPGVAVDGMYTATDESFNALTQEGWSFVLFFAPWCQHCKQLAPSWASLGRKFADDNRIKIGKLDCTANKNSCHQAGVKAYPSMVLFQDGEKVESYEGARNIDGLSIFVKSHLDTVRPLSSRYLPPPPLSFSL